MFFGKKWDELTVGQTIVAQVIMSVAIPGAMAAGVLAVGAIIEGSDHVKKKIKTAFNKI